MMHISVLSFKTNQIRNKKKICVLLFIISLIVCCPPVRSLGIVRCPPVRSLGIVRPTPVLVNVSMI